MQLLHHAFAAIPSKSAESVGGNQNDGKPPPFIRQVFTMMHGYYGSKFTGQFALGVLDSSGKIDKGVKSAQAIWMASLEKFGEVCVIDAVGRLLRDEKFHEWPPTLSRLIAECESQKHQSLEAFKAYKPPVTKLIGVSREALDAHSRKVRAEAAARMAAQAAARRGEIDPVADEGVPALLALASQAVGLAGGDEVAALAGMERRVFGGKGAKRRSGEMESLGLCPMQKRPSCWASVRRSFGVHG